MFFRNMTIFSFPDSLVGEFADLSHILEEHPLQPVATTQLSSVGFIPPMAGYESAPQDTFAHQIGKCLWICLGSEKRVLPAGAVKAAVSAKVAEIQARETKKVVGKARRQIKEDVIASMLPKAFVAPSRINAYIDLEHRILAVDTASAKQAEMVVSELRDALGSFPAQPLVAEKPVSIMLANWIKETNLPPHVTLGDACELRSADDGATVKCQRQELVGDEISTCLEAGKKCTRLSVTWNDHASFMLGEDLVLRKLKFLDGALDTLGDAEPESVADELDALFALMTGTTTEILKMLDHELDFTNPE